MNSLVKDIKIVSCCSKALKIVCVIRTALTVGIIVFSVLEGIKYFLSGDKMKFLK